MIKVTSSTTNKPSTIISSTTTPTPTSTLGTTYSPLPWEEDYFDIINNKPTQAQPTFKPFDPPTTIKLTSTTTSKAPIIITTTTQSVPINGNDDEPIFNLIQFRPVLQNDPNWPKFPSKFPTTKKFNSRYINHH
ncbi:uncharacterized protein LOC128390416 isoform X3 [Panonychus citri]|uniref:uncharacterized protein LOC128390416 isoform X3 n=1 Tax=Panonychus citri TaxID=50023 RepID=UPI0023080798|nr:uncharacterized protein LOC128390416 isoform X3 [Panonychus citri]